jgi:phospholipase C
MSSCGKALMPLMIVSVITWSGCVGLVSGVDQVTVTTAGGGTGVVTSTPNGINCVGLGGGATSGTCQLTFRNSPTLTLTAAPNPGFTFSWSGCKSTSGTTCTVSGAATVTATFTASLQSINHIIFLAQENRSFDSYFGAMRAYWAQSGIPDQQFDGLPQFNPASDPNAGPPPTNPGCDPAYPFIPPNTNPYCQINPNSPAVPSFHLQTMCIENPSPSWGESHRDWAVQNPVAATPTMDGFVDSAANDARQHSVVINGVSVLLPYFDTNGIRAMGYYDGGDLNYYYALATAFSTSDKWFSPIMSRTPPNRQYLIAATSHGYAYPIGTNSLDPSLNPGPTIFEKLEQANPPISWKIYVPTKTTPCDSNPTVTCLLGFTYLHDFTFGTTIKNNPSAYQNKIVPISQFATDLQNNTLPQVAQIEPASTQGLDEHPSDNDPSPTQPPCCSVQAGANYVKSLIDQFMGSSSWPSSVFILTWDEFGGIYDHVPPQASVNPDGIPPVDLFNYDPCYQNPNAGPTCNFNYTGYRVPLVVISPFAKKNFVSHQVRDYTAILKLIESRFSLPALTQRDAAQTGMDDSTTGFFDFNNVPWRTPPTNLPAQNTTGQCYLDHVQ